MFDGCPACLPLHCLRLPHTIQPRAASFILFDRADPLFNVLLSNGHSNMIIDVFRLRGLSPLGNLIIYGVLLPSVIINELVQHVIIRALALDLDSCRCGGAHLSLYVGTSCQFLAHLLVHFNELTARLLCYCGCSCSCHAPRQDPLRSLSCMYISSPPSNVKSFPYISFSLFFDSYSPDIF